MAIKRSFGCDILDQYGDRVFGVCTDCEDDIVFSDTYVSIKYLDELIDALVELKKDIRSN